MRNAIRSRSGMSMLTSIRSTKALNAFFRPEFPHVGTERASCHRRRSTPQGRAQRGRSSIQTSISTQGRLQTAWSTQAPIEARVRSRDPEVCMTNGITLCANKTECLWRFRADARKQHRKHKSSILATNAKFFPAHGYERATGIVSLRAVVNVGNLLHRRRQLNRWLLDNTRRWLQFYRLHLKYSPLQPITRWSLHNQ